jgi:hypothetical protein
MAWAVLFASEFQAEFDAMPDEARDALIATMRILREFGPNARRPHVDTLKASAYSNMKELRFHTSDSGEWRAAFAFDPKQQAIVLVCGDKAGEVQADFYKWLIKVADERYSGYLAWLKAEEAKKKASGKKPKK